MIEHVCKCVCESALAANNAPTWPGSEGLWGDAFLRTLTPFDPAQPKKKKKKNLESDCKLADTVNLQSDRQQRQRRRKANKEVNKDKKTTQ